MYLRNSSDILLITYILQPEIKCSHYNLDLQTLNYHYVLTILIHRYTSLFSHSLWDCTHQQKGIRSFATAYVGDIIKVLLGITNVELAVVFMMVTLSQLRKNHTRLQS